MTNSSNGTNSLESKIKTVNKELETLASQHQFELLIHDNLNHPSYRYDGLHLTHRGTSVLVKNIRSKIVSRTPGIQHSRNNETNHLQQENAVPERKEGVKLEKGESPVQLNTVKHQMPMQQQLPQGPYGHPSIFGLPNFYGHPAYYGQHNPFMQRMFIPFGQQQQSNFPTQNFFPFQ